MRSTDRLVSLVHWELRRLARRYMGREDPDPLTQITALVDAGCLLMSGILVGVAIVRCVSANEWVRELGPLGKGRIPEF